uniref:Uncharacterized protein n=1 Tax=Populus alba TaxID=43335 RepID=A0A4U5N8C8_POPAL|nr:hypothetical protein D5086_0000274980 [Populus alba]
MILQSPAVPSSLSSSGFPSQSPICSPFDPQRRQQQRRRPSLLSLFSADNIDASTTSSPLPFSIAAPPNSTTQPSHFFFSSPHLPTPALLSPVTRTHLQQPDRPPAAPSAPEAEEKRKPSAHRGATSSSGTTEATASNPPSSSKASHRCSFSPAVSFPLCNRRPPTAAAPPHGPDLLTTEETSPPQLLPVPRKHFFLFHTEVFKHWQIRQLKKKEDRDRRHKGER